MPEIYTQIGIGGLFALGIIKMVLDFLNNRKDDPENPEGKLRLVYEGNPMAWIAEQAGGKATTGDRRILDLEPNALHQKIPLVIGSSFEVDTYEQFYRSQ